MRFEWVGVDAGYGKEPAFLRALDDTSEVFVADVHRDQRVWTEEPELARSAAPARPRTSVEEAAGRGKPVTVEDLVKGFGAGRLDALRPARQHARRIAGRYRAPAGLGLGWRGRPRRGVGI